MSQKFTLLELNKKIQDNIYINFPDSVWVIAEISELKINRNGHCYLELIEKDAVTDHIIAKTRATIWAFTFRMIKPYFENSTGHELISGIRVLINANVEFHEIYGFSLNIIDIDPNYTLGELAQKRAEIINQLEQEGVLNMKKELPFPIVPQKIAIISSETAAGYQDFMKQIENNNEGYKYYTKLFPSIMQGTQTEESIIQSLEKIFNYEDFFDIVVIIRGGGSQADLNWFNNYLLAANIAQFPIPVLSGIGHDKDESIVDLVAYKMLKTPTAVAEYIIEKTRNFEEILYTNKERIVKTVSQNISIQKSVLINYTSVIIPKSKNIVDKQYAKLDLAKEKLKNNIQQTFKKYDYFIEKLIHNFEKSTAKTIYKYSKNINSLKILIENKKSLYFQRNKLILEKLESKLSLVNPQEILKRGYSITYFQGNKITDTSKLKKNDEIITQLFKGFIRSNVKEKMKKKFNS